jgi:hypothetical protein
VYRSFLGGHAGVCSPAPLALPQKVKATPDSASFLRYRGQTQVTLACLLVVPDVLCSACWLVWVCMSCCTPQLRLLAVLSVLSVLRITRRTAAWAALPSSRPCRLTCPPARPACLPACQQKWFLLEFLGDDSEIDISCQSPGHHAGGHHPEFSAFSWQPLESLPGGVVDFKQGVYRQVARHFAPEIARRVSAFAR